MRVRGLGMSTACSPRTRHLYARLLHIFHVTDAALGGMVDRLASAVPVRLLWGEFLMRIRTAVASAAIALLALSGSTACSVSSGDTPASPGSESTKEGAKQEQVSQNEPAVDPSNCAVPSDEMPEECEVHPSFAATEEGVPAEGMPIPAPSN